MSVQPKLDIKNKNIDTILVLDFGSQYTQLIARRIRESDVYSEILPWDVDIKKIEDINPKGIILSGGPESVTDLHTPRAPKIVFDLKVPILGICYGMQTLAEQMGGQVTTSEKKEFGFSELTIEDESKLFEGLSEDFHNVWMSHGDKVETLPTEFKLTASTKSAPIAAMEHSSDSIFALQFHPEVTHTEGGKLILDNFIFDICSCKPEWKLDDLITSRVEEIIKVTNGEKVLLGLSGGVDSSVTAALLSKAIGDNLICVFVDNGLLRKNEAEEVIQTFKNEMDLNLIKVDAQKIFLRHLKGIEELLKTLDNWVILNEGFDYLEKIFTFDNYEKAVAFSNDVAALAEIEDHHPLIILEWGKVTVKWWSHKINGLHKNDFICAAKTDLLAK